MIYLVIPVFNRCHLTRRCLQSLSKQNYVNFKVIVVDDGSTDDTQTVIKSDFPEVTILTGDGNLWWTEATNVGIRYAINNLNASDDDFVLTLNNDTEVNESYLQSLVDVSQKYPNAIVGSLSLDISNHRTITFAGTLINFITAKYYCIAKDKLNNDLNNLDKNKQVIPTDSLPGRGMLIPVRIIKSIGYFDSKNYKHYLADIEYTVRAKDRGFQLFVSTSSIVYEHTTVTAIPSVAKLSIGKFIKSFTDFRSPYYLKPRFHFSFKYGRYPLLFFFFDFSRITISYFIQKLSHITSQKIIHIKNK